MNKEKCPGKFNVSLRDVSNIVTIISEESEEFDRALKRDSDRVNDGSGRSCLEKVYDALKQNPEIGKAIVEAEKHFEDEEQILSPEGIALAEENWQKIKKEKEIQDAVEQFRQDLPEMVERRKEEAARVGESYPSLKEICDAASEENNSLLVDRNLGKNKFSSDPIIEGVLIDFLKNN